MRKFFLLLISVFFLSAAEMHAQLKVDNHIFKIIKEESYDQAIQYGNDKLLRIKDKKDFNRRAVPLYLGLGMVYKKAGDYSTAEKNYYAAYKILQSKEKEGKRIRAIDYDILDELSLMYLETGNFSEAGELARKCIRLREQRFSKTNLVRYRSYQVLGKYYFKTAQYDSAYFYFKQYIYFIKNSTHTSKQDLNRYANTYQMLTELELARENIPEALRFAHKNKRLQHHHWTRKEAGKNNLSKIISLNLLSECYSLAGDSAHARKYSAKSLRLYDKVIKTETYHLVPLLLNKGKIEWNAGNYDAAERLFLRASGIQMDFVSKNFSTLTEYEKENFYASVRSNFDILNSFALEKLQRQGSSDSLIPLLFDFQIRTKAIILSESNRLLAQVMNSGDTLLRNKFNEWRKLKNELSNRIMIDKYSDASEKVKELSSSINRLEKEMAQQTALFNESRKEPDWRKVAASLKPGEAAMEIIRVRKYGDKALSENFTKAPKAPKSVRTLTDSIAYLALIIKADTKTSPETVVISQGNALESKSYNYYRNALRFKMDDQYSYNSYWQPFKEKLGNIRQIYVSPDGIYNLVNLSVLRNPGSGSYLIDELSVINVTNTKEILAPRQDFYFKSALLLGRPDYGNKGDTTNASGSRAIDDLFRGGISDLPGTEEEVRAISEYLTMNNIENKVVIGLEASEDFLKNAASRNIFHIATHGFFNQAESAKNPMMRSGLLLAGVISNTSKSEDGVLTAYEASNLNLTKTELVVLSACETGLGELKSGEGVYGLQRAFEVAGVNDILMSMWKVNDQATRKLMVQFYGRLLKERQIANAFKQAQLELRKEYPHPYYWGAFKLIGL
ncbi:MAG: CHAT domain-containing protein [Cytophagaceae bacterium]